MIILAIKKYQLQTTLVSNDSIGFNSFKLNYHRGLSARRTFSSFTHRVSIKLELIIPMQINNVHKRFTQKYGHVYKIAAGGAASKAPKLLAPSGTMATTASTPNISPNASPSNTKNYTDTKNNNPDSAIHAYQRRGVNQYTMPTPFKDQIPQQPSEPSRALIIYPKPKITALSHYVKPKNAVVSYNTNKIVGAEPAYAPSMLTQNSTATTPNAVLPALLPSTETPVVSTVTSEAHNEPTVISQTPFTTSLPETPINTPLNPPPLPTTNLTLNLQPNTGELNLTATINEINKEKIQAEPIQGVITEGCKPANIAAKYKVEYTLHDINSKPFTTTIDSLTTENQISIDELLQELLKRKLASMDLDNTSTTIQLKDGPDITIGSSKFKIKLTALGMAYSTLTESPDDTIIKKFVENLSHLNNTDHELIIIVPPKSSEKLIIETSIHKHLLVAYNAANGKYYAIGFFTSKGSGLFIKNEQVKPFQQAKNGEIITENLKEQRFVPFNNLIEIDPPDSHRIKGDKEYLASLPNEARKLFTGVWETLSLKPIIKFNKNGITKQHGLRMCQAHDTNILNKEKHPKTADQIKQHEKGKAKQKEKQAKQYETKFKQDEAKDL